MTKNKKKAISKQVRLVVYNKCQGHCGYCGSKLELKEMQVDHISPQSVPYIVGGKIADTNSIENLMPSCRACNHYKRDNSLIVFRKMIKTLHERVEKHYINKVAKNFKIISSIEPFDGKFYFEKL
jgi:5-methylcytosine-specific restriction endonuclease McrA